MQQPPDPYSQYPQQQWPQTPDQHTNYSMPQYQPPPPYQVSMQSPMMLSPQKYERSVNKTMKTIAIVLFSIAFACSLLSLAYKGLAVLAGLLEITAFVCVCLI